MAVQKNIWIRLLGAAAFGMFVLWAADRLLEPERSEQPVYEIPEDRKLVIYTAHKANVYEPIVKEFEERTGIFVEIKAGDTLALFEELKTEKPGTFDIMFGGGIENFEECREYFEPYETKEADMLSPAYTAADSAYTPFSVLPTVFVYNNKLVYPAAAPKSWAEMTTDRFKGKIAFADPTLSGSSYTALCTLLQVSDGEPEAVLADFITALDGHLSSGSSAVLDEVDTGTRLVGITSEGMAKQRITEGADLTIRYPEEGTSAVPDATAIVRGTKHPENARAFLDFTVERDTQRLVEEEFLRRSVRTDLGAPQETASDPLITIDYDVRWATEQKETILGEWSAAFGGNR